MKKFIEDLIGVKISINSFILNFLTVLAFLLTGRFLYELNIYSSYELNLNSDYFTIYRMLVLITSLIPVYISSFWYKSWNLLLITNNNSKNDCSQPISRKIYLFSLFLSSLLLYSIFYFSNRYIIFNFLPLISNENNSILFSIKEYLSNSYFVIPYFILTIYSLIKRSSNLMMNLNNSQLYIIFTLLLFNIDSSNQDYIGSINFISLSPQRMQLCFLLIIICFNTLVSALLNYLIFDNALTEVNCKNFESNNVQHLKLLIQISICFCFFVFGLVS